MWSKPTLRLAPLLLLLLFVLVVVSGTGYLLSRLRGEALANHQQAMSLQVRAFEDQLTQTLNLINLIMGQLQESEDEVQTDERLSRALRRVPVLRSLSLLDASGQVITSSNPRNKGLQIELSGLIPPASNRDGELRFGLPWEGRDFSSGRQSNLDRPVSSGLRTLMPIVHRVHANADAPFLLAAINSDWFLNYFLANWPVERGVVELLRYDGRLLLSTSLYERPGQSHLLPADVDLKRREFGIYFGSHEGEEMITAYRASRHYPLLVMIHQPLERVLANWRQEALQVSVAVGLSLLLVIGFTLSAIIRMQRAATQERRALERMRLSATVIDTTRDGIFVNDADNRVLSVNPAFERITGYSRDEMVGRNPSQLSSGCHNREFYAKMWQAITEQGYWSGEIINRAKDGSEFAEWLRISCLYSEQGEVTNYVGVFSDITDQRNAEKQIRKLSLAVEQSPICVIITDLKGDIEYANEAFSETTGYTLEEVIGSNMSILKSGQTDAALYADMWLTINSGRGWEGELVNRRKDGRLYIDHTLIAPVMEQGRVTNLVTVKQDITAQREAEEALRQAKERAERADRSKSAFLANMSHELRTPLNVVLGQAQLLGRDDSLDQEQRQRIDSIRRNGEHLLGLISNLLDVSRMEGGSVQLTKGAVELPCLIQDLAELSRGWAADKGLKMRYQESRALPRMVRTDAVRLRQLLTHLLDNAVKFTQQGEVGLSVDYRPAQGEERARLLFSISDTGCGMSDEKLQGLFLPFNYQLDQLYANQSSGLSMALIKAIAELMGGRIKVESRLDEGSCFQLDLPVEVLFEGEIVASTRGASTQSRDMGEEPPLSEQQRDTLSSMVRRGQISAIRNYLALPDLLADPNPRLRRIATLAKKLDLKGIRELL